MSTNRLSGMRYRDEVYFHEDVGSHPGAYVFYKTISGPPRYVGRSDGNLYGRIRGRYYKYYRYRYCKTDKTAYYWECRYWHRYQDTIDNSFANGGNHPAKPAYLDAVCHKCGR